MNNSPHTPEIYKARMIGAFFLLAFFAYGFGRNLLESTHNTEKYIGALLLITNSVMVLFIGIGLRETLKPYHALVGNIYLFTRAFEALALASGILNIYEKGCISEVIGYFLPMLVLGIGSIPMCLTLYNHKILPSWLSIWGVIGYAIFAFGFFMELIGKAWSMYLLGLGGLWEITFAFWLIFKSKNQHKQK